jgi:hypothetical protein
MKRTSLLIIVLALILGLVACGPNAGLKVAQDVMQDVSASTSGFTLNQGGQKSIPSKDGDYSYSGIINGFSGTASVDYNIGVYEGEGVGDGYTESLTISMDMMVAYDNFMFTQESYNLDGSITSEINTAFGISDDSENVSFKYIFTSLYNTPETMTVEKDGESHTFGMSNVSMNIEFIMSITNESEVNIEVITSEVSGTITVDGESYPASDVIDFDFEDWTGNTGL